MVLDLHQFHRREDLIRKKIGITEKHGIFNDMDVYSLYFNPSTGLFTGIKDNERNLFYEFKKQDDVVKFINALNIKENRCSEFIHCFEETMKMFTDREIKFFEKIKEYEEKISDLEDALNDVDDCLTRDDIRALYIRRGFQVS